MIAPVIFTPEADDDVAEAYSWYENQEPGLGEEFLRCLEARILTIQRQPEIYRVAMDEFRLARLCADSLTKFSTNQLITLSSFIRYFIAHKIRKNGDNDSTIEVK